MDTPGHMEGRRRPRARAATRGPVELWLAASAVLLLALALLLAPAARAANFDVHEGDDLNIVVVTDEIMPGDDEAFLRAVDRATRDGAPAMVVFASPGGALGAGMHMGLIVAESGLPTFVPEGEVCASACALAWMAGAPRMMTTTSEIGFHQPYDDRDGEMVPSIEANAVVGHYIATIGIGPRVVSFAVSSPPDRMSWLDFDVAREIGLEVTEVAASEGPVALASSAAERPGVGRRLAPTDENAAFEPGIPLPVMRQLTPVETASLGLTGAVDGTREAGLGLPVVTTLSPETMLDAGAPHAIDPPHATDQQHATDLPSPIPAGLRLAVDAVAPDGPATNGGPLVVSDGPGAGPAFDEMNEGVADWHDEPPLAGDEPALAAAGADIHNVELAVMFAVRRYGDGGGEALRTSSAACWRDMRDGPSVDRLQYCHVIDLVSAALVGPEASGFQPFAIEVRLRAHRAMVGEDAAIPADFAAAWGAEAEMVVAAMGAH